MMINNFKEIKAAIEKLLDDKKAEHIVEIDLSSCNSRLSDLCIIASGTSSRHMQSVGDYVYKYLKELKLSPKLEGDAKSGWIMIDAGGIEIHLFKPELRDYYDLESLMKEGKRPSTIE